MIIKRSECYTPILMKDFPKKYLQLNEKYEYLSALAPDSYKFTITDIANPPKSFSVKRVGSYKELYGMIYNNNKIIAIVVEDKDSVRWLIIDSGIAYSYRTRIRRSMLVHNVPRKNTVDVSFPEMKAMFIFNLEYSISDLNKDVQDKIVNEVFDELRASLPEIKEEVVVHEEKYVIGNWITTNNVGIDPSGHYNNGGSGFRPNITLQIRTVDEYDGYKVYFFENHRDGIYSGNFRHATPEEIENEQPF